jgi:hypothetical protein
MSRKITMPSALGMSLRTPLVRPGTAIGMTPTRPDPVSAQPTTPGAPPQPTNVDRNTQTYTYITRATLAEGEGTPVLYNGDRIWAKIILTLETAGPVAVGTLADIGPVLSGKGRLLVTNVPAEFIIAKTSRLYILATAINRVSVTIEPLPWMEQLANAAETLAQAGKGK